MEFLGRPRSIPIYQRLVNSSPDGWRHQAQTLFEKLEADADQLTLPAARPTSSQTQPKPAATTRH